MNYRQAALVDGKALAANNVEIYNLRGMKPISAIDVILKILNQSSTPTEHPAEAITKIQLVDGSEVLTEVSGKQAIAIDYYHNKRPSQQGLNYISANYSWANARINFGRWLWDEEIAFDPSKFKNPQLIVTTDINAGGGGTPVAQVLEICAQMFDKRSITPKGFLRLIESYRYSVVASGEHTIDLPTDLVIKMLAVQGDYKDTSLIQQINKLKLTEENDQSIPFNNNLSDMLKMLASELPPWHEKIRFNGTTSAVEYFITPFYEAVCALVGIMATPNYGSATQTDGGTMDIDMNSAAECDGIVHGWAPHGVVAWDMGDPWTPGDWYDVKPISNLKLKLTAGSSASASGTNKVILQQYKPY